MSLGVKQEIQIIFNNCECREIDELSVVIQNMIQDLKREKINIEQLKKFFAKNKDAIIALMDLCRIEHENLEDIIRKLINLIARKAVFSVGGLLRKYAQFSEEEYLSREHGEEKLF